VLTSGAILKFEFCGGSTISRRFPELKIGKRSVDHPIRPTAESRPLKQVVHS
jgi:hypothetical protein